MAGRMKFKKKSFERVHAHTFDDTVNMRFNDAERAMLNEIKDWLRIDADGTAVKTAMKIGHNVLQGTFSREMLRYLSSPRRMRPGPRRLK